MKLGSSALAHRRADSNWNSTAHRYVIVVYAVSEPAAYHLSELIEDHAYDTYNGFLTEHEEMLKKMHVEGYPTIFFYRAEGGEYIKYNGNII